MKPFYILLIDDNEEYCKTLKNLAWQIGHSKGMNVQISYYQTLEEGFAELEAETKYQALILDAKALLTKNQQVDDFNFLSVALHRLEKLNNKTGRYHIPFAVNTGYYDKFREFDALVAEQKGKIFDKSTQEAEMFDYLFIEVNNAQDTKLSKMYDDVFEVFTLNYLPDSFRLLLLSILKDMEIPGKTTSVLREIRVMQDAIYNALNAKSKVIVPDALSLSSKNNHLSGNVQKSTIQGRDVYNPTSTVYQTVTISQFAFSIHKIASTFASHATLKPSNVTVKYWEAPSIYAVKSLSYSLLELLLWFKALMAL
jgi:hypothetical protein